MSNRTLAFLILVAICSSVLGFIYYFFIANVGSIVFDVGWLDWVKVELSWEFGNSYDIECDKKCLFKKIPPIKYSINISKEWYVKYSESISLNRWEIKEIKVDLQKEVQIETIMPTTENKIKSLKYKKYLASKEEDNWEKLSRTEIGTYNSNVYSFSNNNWFLNIFEFDWDTENELFNLEWIKVQNISLNTIDWVIIYSDKDGNYFYDLNNKTNYKTNIEDDINYIKKTTISDKYIVNGKMWVYIYNTTTNDYTKNTLYDDFVILEDSQILWLIKNSSKDKISLLNFDNNGKNKLVLHNITTREKKVIYETDSDMQYIFYKDWNIKYIDSSNQLFNLTELNIK